MSISGVINRGLNGIGEGSLYVLDSVGSFIAPSALGYIGGWVTGVGVQVGILQGLSSAAYYRLIHIRFQKYIDKNTGDGADEISQRTAYFFKGIGIIASIAMPIVFTFYTASYANRAAASLTEGGLAKWLFTSTPTRPYTFVAGFVLNWCPTLVQHWISFCRNVDDSGKKI